MSRLAETLPVADTLESTVPRATWAVATVALDDDDVPTERYPVTATATTAAPSAPLRRSDLRVIAFFITTAPPWSSSWRAAAAALGTPRWRSRSAGRCGRTGRPAVAAR